MFKWCLKEWHPNLLRANVLMLQNVGRARLLRRLHRRPSIDPFWLCFSYDAKSMFVNRYELVLFFCFSFLRGFVWRIYKRLFAGSFYVFECTLGVFDWFLCECLSMHIVPSCPCLFHLFCGPLSIRLTAHFSIVRAMSSGYQAGYYRCSDRAWF